MRTLKLSYMGSLFLHPQVHKWLLISDKVTEWTMQTVQNYAYHISHNTKHEQNYMKACNEYGQMLMFVFFSEPNFMWQYGRRILPRLALNILFQKKRIGRGMHQVIILLEE